ncbi:hypothetical protein [Faecalibacterium sp. An77]|uniref:hypothetical protein n=1 Tax=Faecalibacterium sp. An77 TaxID=1965655 RepID=UPI001184DF49|nr:hypothetical protein [Faecalibacterium sp. An77]
MTENVKGFLVKKYSKKPFLLRLFAFDSKAHLPRRPTQKKRRAGLRFGFAGQPGAAISLKNFMFSSLCYKFEVFPKNTGGAVSALEAPGRTVHVPRRDAGPSPSRRPGPGALSTGFDPAPSYL